MAAERNPNWADEELRRELDALPSDIEEQREALYGDHGLEEEDLPEFEDGDDEDYDPLEEPFDYGFGEDMED